MTDTGTKGRHRKKHGDRDHALLADKSFSPMNIEVKKIETCIYLLKCPETDIVLQAISALDKFAIKCEDNVHQIYKLNILDSLIYLMDHTDIFIKRFCFKHMCQLCVIPETKSYLIENESTFSYIVYVLHEEEDVIVQEFSSYILAELTTQCIACVRIVEEANIPDVLFLRITSSDPDVQKNSLQIMYNILQDPTGIESFKTCKQFRFEPIVALLQSEYIVIQTLACQVMDYLTKQWYDPALTDLFRTSGCFEEFMKVLQNKEWKDLHSLTLSVLSNCVENPVNAKYINNSGFLKTFVSYMKKVQDPQLLQHALDIISKISKLEAGREVLYEEHVEQQICSLIKDGKIMESLYITLANMVHHLEMLDYIRRQGLVNVISDVLAQDSLPWMTRKAAVTAVCELVKADRTLALEMVNNNKHEKLINLLHQPPGTLPNEVITEVINCLAFLGFCENIRSKLSTRKTVDALLYCLEDKNGTAKVKISALDCLSTYICESEIKESFLAGEGVDKVFSCLKDHCNLSLQQAAGAFIQLSGTDPSIAAAFIKIGVLHWLLEQRGRRKAIPVWETALEALFKSCLSAKFAYTGRLSFNDITTDGFYMTRNHEKRFPLLEELLDMQVSPIRPIYISNFSPPTHPPVMNPSMIKSLRPGRTQKKPSGKSKSLDKGSESNGMISNLIAASYGTCAPDPYLPQYLNELQEKLGMVDKQFPPTTGLNLKTIREKVRILAIYVSAQMSGPDPNRMCDKHMRELHLNELKVDLGTNVIPIGHVRVGLQLERAFLYKVLADRVDLPCALVRGEFGQAWIEVAIPKDSGPYSELSNTEKKDCNGLTEKFSSLPIRLLKPNYIVDLMYDIGNLIPLNTNEAKQYCQIPI